MYTLSPVVDWCIAFVGDALAYAVALALVGAIASCLDRLRDFAARDRDREDNLVGAAFKVFLVAFTLVDLLLLFGHRVWEGGVSQWWAA